LIELVEGRFCPARVSQEEEIEDQMRAGCPLAESFFEDAKHRVHVLSDPLLSLGTTTDVLTEDGSTGLGMILRERWRLSDVYRLHILGC
jgi:hypothetical protein